MKRLLGRIIRAFIILMALPYALVLVYAFLPPVSIPVLGDMLSFKTVKWDWRDNERISPHLARAIIAAEDQKFCNHHGVDWQALGHVIRQAQYNGDLSQGASTVNMQVSKNLFLWPLPKLMRKPFEVPLALWIDLIWSKQRTMEVYMNIAEFGDGVYGAEAAAQKHFRKSAYSLTAHEASMLAAILPNPEFRNPTRPSPYVGNYSAHIRNISSRVNGGCTQ